MKVPPSNKLREQLGFDAIVIKYRDTVFVTNIERGVTHAVSLIYDVEYLNPDFQDVADVIADRMVAEVTADEIIYSLDSLVNLPPDCPFCDI